MLNIMHIKVNEMYIARKGILTNQKWFPYGHNYLTVIDMVGHLFLETTIRHDVFYPFSQDVN